MVSFMDIICNMIDGLRGNELVPYKKERLTRTFSSVGRAQHF